MSGAGKIGPADEHCASRRLPNTSTEVVAWGPCRPTVPGRLASGRWRRFWEFGGGTLADMGCHYMDLPFWALELGTPKVVTADAPASPHIRRHAKISCAGRSTTRGTSWSFIGTTVPDAQTACPIHLREWSAVNWNSGVLFVGEDGMTCRL